MTARILLLDLESAPIISAHWGLWNQNISIDQIIEHPRVIGFAAKWLDGPGAKFWSEYHHGRTEMLTKARDLMDEATAIVGWNSRNFDETWLLGEFEREGLEVPSPSKSIDLMRIARKNLRYPSNNLAYVSKVLVEDTKLSTGGFKLWRDCLWGDDDAKRKAWAKMKRYCIQDTNLLQPLYEELRPYFPASINVAALSGNLGTACTSCEGTNLQRRGYAVTTGRRYARYQCQDCGKWNRSSSAEAGSAPLIGVTR